MFSDPETEGPVKGTFPEGVVHNALIYLESEGDGAANEKDHYLALPYIPQQEAYCLMDTSYLSRPVWIKDMKTFLSSKSNRYMISNRLLDLYEEMFK